MVPTIPSNSSTFRWSTLIVRLLMEVMVVVVVCCVTVTPPQNHTLTHKKHINVSNLFVDPFKYSTFSTTRAHTLFETLMV